MIRAYFGLAQNPFATEHISLLPHQQTVFDTLSTISLTTNEDIKSRITYSVIMPKIAPDDMQSWILAELDKAGLGHNTLTPEALALIVRSAEGVIRRARNLCLACLLEAIRDQTKTVDLKQVNHVLIQPHWRNHHDLDQIGYSRGP